VVKEPTIQCWLEARLPALSNKRSAHPGSLISAAKERSCSSASNTVRGLLDGKLRVAATAGVVILYHQCIFRLLVEFGVISGSCLSRKAVYSRQESSCILIPSYSLKTEDIVFVAQSSLISFCLLI
jgi:hypothetical protein